MQMEQMVCERLAASNVYDFAWIGYTSRDGRELTAHAAAGAIDYLDNITVSLDENDPTGRGPIAQAVNTQSVQLSRNICEDPAYEQWCEDRDCQTHSVIAVPIVYKGRRYGVLNLYTERSTTIGDIEQAIIRQLAEIVGHAITALERGKSLLTDRMIEDSLTDRQRTALEAACYSGFFDSPRESSGEDVAASLDISSSTFHQHLRKAQKNC